MITYQLSQSPITRRTERAFMLTFEVDADSDKQAWFPLSQCHVSPEGTYIEIPLWLFDGKKINPDNLVIV